MVNINSLFSSSIMNIVNIKLLLVNNVFKDTYNKELPVVGGGYSGRVFAPTACRRPPEKFERDSARTSINLNLALSLSI